MSNTRNYCNEIVLKETSQELGLSLAITRRIVSSQSEFVKQVIEAGRFETIRLCYLGSFVAKHKEIQMINHLRGLDPDQRKDFRKKVLSGKIKFNWWENKDKK